MEMGIVFISPDHGTVVKIGENKGIVKSDQRVRGEKWSNLPDDTIVFRDNFGNMGCV